MHRGVYVVGHEALAPLARESAAVLACSPRAVISHASAARVWQLIDASDTDPVDVTVVGRKARRRAGIRIHRTAAMSQKDIRYLHRLPVTSPARTIRDLAAVEHPDLERALSEAQVRKLIRPRELDLLLEQAHGRPGVGILRKLVQAEKAGFTRSEAERRFRALLKDARLPQPRANARIEGFEVDFLWPQDKLVVEVDGFAAHGHRGAFERDRRKDAALIAVGYQVLRITWRQLVEEPVAVAALLAVALTTRRTRG